MHSAARTPLAAALVAWTLAAAYAGAADDPVDRWAHAAGGREKLAAIASLYREATVDVAGFHGTIHVWRTSDGRYRKEEQVATFSAVEVFDGTTGTIKQGTAAPRRMEAAELARARSTAFANSSATFFAFFPDRRRGRLVVEQDGTIVMQPEGGIDWRVTLDRQTWLPRSMVHKEGERTIVVTFASYETVDGIQFEKEIHRSTGDPRFDAVIRFTKTAINPPLDPSLFSLETSEPTAGVTR